ncbi:MAG: PEP-CTERM sorting domain-containing protein [Phycisphaerales bacterium]
MRLKIGMMMLGLLLCGSAAMADWDVGDPYKMHYPQLPGGALSGQMDFWPWMGDDWQCTQSGAVDDIHFWITDMGTSLLLNVNVRIYDDDRSGAYSKPGTLLWQHAFATSQFTVRDAPGFTWLDQVNITNITDPFVQTQGTTYWLVLSATGQVSPYWNSSVSPLFQDVAVHWTGTDWMMYGEGMQTLSFVITPEPTSIALLTIGGLALLRRRRH